jgi:hypothetical protein
MPLTFLLADVNTTYSANAFPASWSATTITFADQPQCYISGTVSASPPVRLNISKSPYCATSCVGYRLGGGAPAPVVAAVW